MGVAGDWESLEKQLAALSWWWGAAHSVPLPACSHHRCEKVAATQALRATQWAHRTASQTAENRGQSAIRLFKWVKITCLLFEEQV